mmetsp:Transcript_26352/g.38187  ORF Transcript_26352/g.38187 Transcript_26352/m.38187 type:complete len:99 (+) Transcript_26352:92-388(+)
MPTFLLSSDYKNTRFPLRIFICGVWYSRSEKDGIREKDHLPIKRLKHLHRHLLMVRTSSTRPWFFVPVPPRWWAVPVWRPHPVSHLDMVLMLAAPLLC